MARDSFANDELIYECDDDTGDCGACFPGFTGLQCADCADDFEIVYDYSDYYDEGQDVYCRKECPEGWKLLDKYFRWCSTLIVISTYLTLVFSQIIQIQFKD